MVISFILTVNALSKVKMALFGPHYNGYSCASVKYLLYLRGSQMNLVAILLDEDIPFAFGYSIKIFCNSNVSFWKRSSNQIYIRTKP